jgi:hypothetical protein
VGGSSVVEEKRPKENSEGSAGCRRHAPRAPSLTDFIMRACLVLAECPVRLRVASFKAENVDRIVREWNEITAAIERAVDLLVDWQAKRDALPYLQLLEGKENQATAERRS